MKEGDYIDAFHKDWKRAKVIIIIITDIRYLIKVLVLFLCCRVDAFYVALPKVDKEKLTAIEILGCL